MDKQEIEKLLEMGPEGYVKECLELKLNIKALATSITDLIQNSPVSKLARFSAVVCLSSAGAIDMLALCGTKDGMRLAANHIMDTLEEHISSTEGMSKGEQRVVQDSDGKAVIKVS